MDKYWLRIGLGALGIFGVGLLIVRGIEYGKNKVKGVIAGNDPITVPIGFLPFNVAGERFGTVRTMKLVRDKSQHLESVQLSVRLGDRADAERLPACDLYLETPQEINDSTSFVCAPAEAIADGSLRELGTILLTPTDRRITFYADSGQVSELRKDQLGLNLIESSTDGADAASSAVADAAQGFADGVAGRDGQSPAHGAITVNGAEQLKFSAGPGGFRMQVVGKDGEIVKVGASAGGVMVSSVGDKETSRLANAYADAKASAAAARKRGDQAAAARAEDRASDILGEMDDFTTPQFTRVIEVTRRVAGEEATLPVANKMAEVATQNDEAAAADAADASTDEAPAEARSAIGRIGDSMNVIGQQMRDLGRSFKNRPPTAEEQRQMRALEAEMSRLGVQMAKTGARAVVAPSAPPPPPAMRTP